MMQINSAIAVLVVLVGLALVSSIAVNIYTQFLYKKCVYVLILACEWFEAIREERVEISHHEGTD